MPASTEAVLHYDKKTIVLHWLTAILVIGLWCVGQTIDMFPRGGPRITARSLHICTGALLTLIFIYRIWWRSTAGAKLPPASTGLVQVAAKSVHWILYGAVLATLLLGLFNAWVRGDNLFDLVRIPAFDPGNKALRHDVEDWHGLLANIVLAVAALHAAAALVHHYVWKDQVLRRMLPGKAE
jgi:cytochrome b561